jgi:hypothetical protein
MVDDNIIKGAFQKKISNELHKSNDVDHLETAKNIFSKLPDNSPIDMIISDVFHDFGINVIREESEQQSDYKIDLDDPDAIACPKCKMLTYITENNKICLRNECRFDIYKYYYNINIDTEIVKLRNRELLFRKLFLSVISIGITIMLFGALFMQHGEIWVVSGASVCVVAVSIFGRPMANIITKTKYIESQKLIY